MGDDVQRLVDASVECLRRHEPAGGYYGCFSGGKDSVLLKALAARAGVKVDWHYNVTTIDPPELVRFIRKAHPEVQWVRPRFGNFFRRAAEVKGFPTRRGRWCCDEYKEGQNPNGRVLLMGIRAEESAARAARWTQDVTQHRRSKSTVVIPIREWASDELWVYLRGEGVAYCSLYDEGFHRLGCIGCPMAGRHRRREFDRWPRYEEKWRRVFRRVWERRTGTIQRDGRPWFGDRFFADWTEMWAWWLSNRPMREWLQQSLPHCGGE